MLAIPLVDWNTHTTHDDKRSIVPVHTKTSNRSMIQERYSTTL
jgi:hypothetical protein